MRRDACLVGAKARRLAARGWPVLPLHAPDGDGHCTCGKRDCRRPGKHPRTQKGLLDATTDPATLERWWLRWPDANVGVRTGEASGLLVLDVDGEGGADALHDLERAHGELPPSVQALSGGGGRHILFEHVAGLGNARGGLPEGIDVRGDGGYFVAPPSVHVSGRAYEWEADYGPGEVELAAPPAWLIGLLTGSRNELGQAPPLPEVIPVGQRHTALTSAAGTMRRRGMAEAVILAALGEMNATQCASPLPADEVERIARDIAAKPATAPAWRPARAGGGAATRAEVEARMSGYLHLTGTGHVRFALAVAVTAQLDGPPLWGMLVGPASSGKTEAIRALDAVADARASEITAPGLLGWQGSASKGRPIGLLARIGHRGRALVTVSDMSGLLATSDRGGRDQVFALLRDAYDGHVLRHLGSAPEALEWQGRLTLLVGATPAIDDYTSHANALGPRWVNFRLPSSSTDDRRKASAAARRQGTATEVQRREVRALVAEVVGAAVETAREVELTPALEVAIDDTTVVACYARTAVEREPYGARSITNVPEPEDSPRLAGQLAQLARGLLGLGLHERDAVEMVRRAALDSIPRPAAVCSLCSPRASR